MNLKLCLDNVDRGSRKVIAGNMNATVGGEKAQEMVGARGGPGTNDNRNVLVHVCMGIILRITNIIYNEKAYTCIHGDN